MADDEQQQPDEIDRLIGADPHAHRVDGDTQAWLLTGDDQMKLARDLVAKQQKQSE